MSTALTVIIDQTHENVCEEYVCVSANECVCLRSFNNENEIMKKLRETREFLRAQKAKEHYTQSKNTISKRHRRNKSFRNTLILFSRSFSFSFYGPTIIIIYNICVSWILRLMHVTTRREKLL